MKSLAFASIAHLQNLIKKKEISPQELIRYFIQRFEQFNPKLNCALEIFDEQSIIKASNCQGPLLGIPGIIKDNICQKNRITSCASKILENFRATYDATAISRLKQEGACMIGRANCDEFAMGSSNETSYYGKTYNPWDVTKVPGGSSGGSIVAVAAGLTPWALGSETGGSVRLPAAFCGVVGLKPTYGLISRSGLIAYASSLDQIGVATRTIDDNARILSVLAGHDSADSTTLPVDKKDYTQNLSGALKPNLKIGIIENVLNAPGIDPEVKNAITQAIEQLRKLGATITMVTLPSAQYWAAVYFILSRAEAASNLARFDGVAYGYRDADAQTLTQMYENTRQKGFGKEVKARIIIGNYVLSVGHAEAFYKNAKIAQRLIHHEFAQVFNQVDLLIAPTAPAPAFTIGAFDNNKLQMDLQDLYTCSVNLAGIPALSIPCGMSSTGLPIGFQLIGPHLSESLLYQTAYAYEQQTPWHTMHPKGFE